MMNLAMLIKLMQLGFDVLWLASAALFVQMDHENVSSPMMNQAKPTKQTHMDLRLCRVVSVGRFVQVDSKTA